MDSLRMDPVTLPLPDADLRFYPHFLDPQQCDRWLDRLTCTIDWRQEPIRIYGRSLLQPRLTAWYGDPGTSYTYSHLTLQPLPWTPELLELKAAVDAAAGIRFNSVLLNLYRSGGDSMGWHSDDEPELGQNPVIASLSLGGTRRFILRHRLEPGLKHELALTSGSLLIMAGSTQHYWQHQVPKTRRPVPPRINLTFRVIYSASAAVQR